MFIKNFKNIVIPQNDLIRISAHTRDFSRELAETIVSV